MLSFLSSLVGSPSGRGGLIDCVKERREAHAQFDDDDRMDPMDSWAPKDSVENVKVRGSMAVKPFECDGTIWKHYFVERSPETVRSPHRVEASTQNPAKQYQQISTIESLTPFDCERYDEIDWDQCETCNKLDKVFLEEVDTHDVDNLNREMRMYEQTSKQRAKRRKLESKNEAVGALSSSLSASKDDDPSLDPKMKQLRVFQERLRLLKKEDIKKLCRENNLPVSGDKDELAYRVVKCKLHGGPGVCPTCKNSKLKYEYPSNASKDILVVPTHVDCRHRTSRTHSCHYRLTFDQHNKRNGTGQGLPLKDFDGILEAASLEPGFIPEPLEARQKDQNQEEDVEDPDSKPKAKKTPPRQQEKTKE